MYLKATLTCLLSTTVSNKHTFCAEPSLKELQFALLVTLSYPDQKQSGSNGLEHVSMDNQHIKNSVVHSRSLLFQITMMITDLSLHIKKAFQKFLNFQQ